MMSAEVMYLYIFLIWSERKRLNISIMLYSM